MIDITYNKLAILWNKCYSRTWISDKPADYTPKER